MEKGVKIFFAIAPGIAVGLYAAYQFGHLFELLWILGALMGGVLSYLLFEFRAVIKAVPVALKRATHWRPDKDAWDVLFLGTLGLFSALITCVAVFMLSMYLSMYADAVIEGVGFWGTWSSGFKPSHSPIVFLVRIFCIVSGVSLVSLILWWSFLPFAFFILCDFRDGKDREFASVINSQASWLIKFANPIAVLFYWPVKGIWHVPALAGDLWRFGKSFLREFILIVHSQDRSLCFTVTFLGVVIGYVTQANIWASAIVGGIAGVIYAKSKAREWVVARLQNGFAS